MYENYFENLKLVCQLLEKIFCQNFEHEVHQNGPKERREQNLSILALKEQAVSVAQKRLTAARDRRIFFFQIMLFRYKKSEIKNLMRKSCA
jgi:hypothetical protein